MRIIIRKKSKKDGKKFKIIPIIGSWVRPKERHNGLSKSTKENKKAKYWMGVKINTLEWFQAFVTQNDKDSKDSQNNCRCHKGLMKSEPKIFLERFHGFPCLLVVPFLR